VSDHSSSLATRLIGILPLAAGSLVAGGMGYDVPLHPSALSGGPGSDLPAVVWLSANPSQYGTAGPSHGSCLLGPSRVGFHFDSKLLSLTSPPVEYANALDRNNGASYSDGPTCATTLLPQARDPVKTRDQTGSLYVDPLPPGAHTGPETLESADPEPRMVLPVLCALAAFVLLRRRRRQS
jgi:hypothetical protein